MENLNAEQIKKALECCTSTDKTANCPIGCPFGDINSCEENLMYHALALITSQEQRIKELTAKVAKWEEECDLRGDMWFKLNEENKRLTEENERLHASCTELTRKMQDNVRAENEELRKSSECDVRKLKADTVRKMQERLKAQKFTHKNLGDLVYVEDIDQIAKEMIGEGK